MTQLYVTVSVGTAATLLALLLLLLRAAIPGRRTLLTLARWWVASDTRTSCLVLAPLSAIAGCAFAFVPASEWQGSLATAPNMPAPQTAAMSSVGRNDDPALAALRAYVRDTEATQPTLGATSPPVDTAELPDVDSMIGKLVARLESHPNDVQGWRMLGWSYLNTGRPEDAARAYESALKLEPGNPETQKALEAARSAQSTSGATSSSARQEPATSPGVAMSPGEGGSGDLGMIRDMVDRLDARLASTPHDEAGWLRLMRSRMVLGENEAARTALTKALAAFAGDAAAKSRLTAAARELGIDGSK